MSEETPHILLCEAPPPGRNFAYLRLASLATLGSVH